MFDNNNENYERTYQPYYETPVKKRSPLKAVGKAVLSLALVACVSVASITGYVWLTEKPAEAGMEQTTAPAVTGTTVPYVQTANVLPAEGVLTIPEVFVKASPWVVSISCTHEMTAQQGWFYGQGSAPSATSTGTGIIMSADGYIITNHHVVDGASSVSVTANGVEYEAAVIGLDEKTDIAVIKIDGKNLPAAEFGDSSQVIVGETAIVIGNPLGSNLADTLTQGVISAKERQIEFTDSNNQAFYITLIQTDAAVSPGNSGGPLINNRGQVIGVINSKISADNVEGIGFAIPVNMAMAIANDLIANGEVTIRPMLGISVSVTSEAQARQYNEFYKDAIAAGTTKAITPGIIVETVAAGSSAERGGMKVGDEIIAFNGVKVSTASELNYEKEKCFVGDTCTVTIIRAGVEMTLTISFVAGDAV